MFQETFIVQLPDLCPLSMYAFVHVCTNLTLDRSINLYMQVFPRSKHMIFCMAIFPCMNIRSCKMSADIGPSTYTGCSESFPFCHLYSNGDGIWGFATCEAVQVWV